MLLVTIAISIVSCHDTESKLFSTRRIVVLETNTTSFIYVPKGLDSIYRDNDTVWVNLMTHRIDDLDSNAMMSVINPH